MANPFPGMDPYLEGDLWMSVHTDLCAEIARQLAPKVRPKYKVLSTRRVVLAPPNESERNGESERIGGHRFPDVGILTAAQPSEGARTGVATAPLILPAALPEPIPHVSVEIRDVARRSLVTCIEVLSPTNKTGPGREEYAGNRFEVLSSSAHLLEIDLLRAGTRFATATPPPPAAYFVFLNRVERRHEVETWPIPLAARLPEVAVPLLPGDADAVLDLQAALTTVYDILGYDDLIDYRLPPPGPLTPEEASWIDEQLRRAGRRPA
ncbi:MAG: DUF4058 family protein [Gemmataceae bacterium]|nr:DUF4058 family protein [Gemmataceae bacterium]